MSINHDQPYILTIENILSENQCHSLIEYIDVNKPKIASVHMNRDEVFDSNFKNNERIIKTDVELAGKIFESSRHKLPAKVHGGELVGLNECFRYKPRMYFAPQADDPSIFEFACEAFIDEKPENYEFANNTKK